MYCYTEEQSLSPDSEEVLEEHHKLKNSDLHKVYTKNNNYFFNFNRKMARKKCQSCIKSFEKFRS